MACGPDLVHQGILSGPQQVLQSCPAQVVVAAQAMAHMASPATLKCTVGLEQHGRQTRFLAAAAPSGCCHCQTWSCCPDTLACLPHTQCWRWDSSEKGA